MLEDTRLKEFIDTDIHKHGTTYAQLLDAWKNKVAKARRILVEGFQDHIVSSIHGKENTYDMWKALIDLFQNRDRKSVV